MTFGSERVQWTGKAVVFKDFPKYVLTSCLDTMFFVAQDEALLADGGIKHLKYVLKLSNIVWRCHFKTVTSCNIRFSTPTGGMCCHCFQGLSPQRFNLERDWSFLGLTDRKRSITMLPVISCHPKNRKESRFMGNAAFL